jgi:hypothetical protein
LESSARVGKLSYEAVILLAWHEEVDAVVPGNVALVAQSSNERAASEKVSDIVAVTKPHNIVEY